MASVVLALAACGGGGGGSKSSTTAHDPYTGGTDGAEGADGPSVDPTVPSWIPKSCIAYHKAVVQAIDCQAVDQGKRDAIKKAYDDMSASWKAEADGDKARVDEIGATCTTSTESVRADIGGKCI